MKRFPLPPFLALLLALSSILPDHASAAADPTPSPLASPDAQAQKIDALAKAIIAAPTDDERRRLLAASPPDLANDERLRRRVRVLIGERIYAGEYDRARALNVFSRLWCEEHGDPVGVMLGEWSEGNIEASRGNNQAALAKFEKAGGYFARIGDTRREADSLSNASIIYYRFGDYRRALAGAERALAIHRQIGDRDRTIVDLEAIGNIYLDEGQPDRAAGYYQEGLERAGDDEAWQVYLFQNVANARAARGDNAGAIALLEKTLALTRKIKDRSREGGVLTTLADFELDAGHVEKAESLYREALAEGEAAGETQRQTIAVTGLGNVAARRLDHPEAMREALSLSERATALARQTGVPDNIWRARLLAGHLLRLAGRKAEARGALQEAIAAIEDERGRLTGGDEEAVSFLEDKVVPYQEMVALLVDENRPADAFAFAEWAKARVLLEILHGPQNGLDEALSPAEHDALKQCGNLIASLNKELAAAPAGQTVDVEARLRRARVAREAAEEKVLTAHPELRRQLPPHEPAASDGSSLAALEVLTAKDGPGTAFLEYVVGEEETLAFVWKRPKGAAGSKAAAETQVFHLPLGRAALARRTALYRSTLADRGLGWVQEARTLGDDLLGPVRMVLADVENLIIVPDGPLWELPFQTLPAIRGDGLLRPKDTLAGLRLSFAPSLGFLKQAIGKAGVAKVPVRLLAFGNPALAAPSGGAAAQLALPAAARAAGSGMLRGDEWVPLPAAEREVRELARLYGEDNSRVFVGKDAREATFRQEAGGDYDVIHFATHGICNNTAPLYSHLLLSQVDLPPEEDGLLEAWELMRLPVRARLVVLSACETARGRVGAGEGMIGLCWALFTAGCPSCVVSQWKVDSESNTALMVEFHRQLRAGAGRAEALRRASLALAARPGYGHPFYWAPFVLIGDGD